MNIYEKLQKARVELQESGLKKSGYNKFANFDYFELKDFLPKVNEIFLKLKLFSKFDLLENEGVLTIINSEKADETLTFTTPKAEILLKGQNGLQQIGSTHTYLKRYCYYNALEIIINDEVDATIDKDKQQDNRKAKKQTKQYTEEEKREKGIQYIVNNFEPLQEQISKEFGIDDVIEIDNLENDKILEIARFIKEKIVKGA